MKSKTNSRPFFNRFFFSDTRIAIPKLSIQINYGISGLVFLIFSLWKFAIKNLPFFNICPWFPILESRGKFDFRHLKKTGLRGMKAKNGRFCSKLIAAKQLPP